MLDREDLEVITRGALVVVGSVVGVLGAAALLGAAVGIFRVLGGV